jgi:hypothetical protein
MTAVAGKRDPLPLAPSASPALDGLLSAWLMHDASPAKVLVLAALPVATAIWALLSPPFVLSQEMTWDLLFNLAGAWQVHVGHVAHVDFHEPVGQLNFLLTEIGFRLVGVGPRAFLAGNVLMAVALFAAAVTVAARRLPPLPAAIFVMFVCLLALMPANVGAKPTAHTFAMSYNRYGSSCISVLFLALFVPPRAWRWGSAVDVTVAAALLTAMFYLKVTYFLVGVAALPVALVICPHVRSAPWLWCALAGGACALAAAPFNHAYWLDLFAVAGAGQMRNVFADYLDNFLQYSAEYAPYFAALAIAFWMWCRGQAPLRLPMATGFILAGGAALLSQNAQVRGLPAAVIIAFLFYDVLRDRHLQHDRGGGKGLLAALLIFPFFSAGTSMASLIDYNIRASDEHLLRFEGTSLRGLAVPAESRGLLAAFAAPEPDYHLLNRARAASPRYELSSSEYVETLLDAVSLLSETSGAQGRIAVLDQVNPFPFMLGLAPPRGGNLWSGPDTPKLTPDRFFADADRVLIPKFATYGAWTRQMQAEYGPFLEQHFPLRSESDRWILLSRDPRAPVADDPPPPTPEGLFVSRGVSSLKGRRIGPAWGANIQSLRFRDFP